MAVRSADVKIKVESGVVPDYGWKDPHPEFSSQYLYRPLLRIVDHGILNRTRPGALRVFDAGCGNGAFIRELGGWDCIVSGCDASASGIEYAKKHYPPNGRIEQLSV